MPPVVLVAEDDDDLREAIAWSLRADGYRVLTVASGESALWAMMMRPIDLLVVDLKLPKLDGSAVLRLMRDDERLCRIPVVVTTAFPELAPREVTVIRKPFPAHLLTEVVNAMLAGKPKRRTLDGMEPLDTGEDDAVQRSNHSR